jgi:aryl-alcohol dehydrogenase-like predicted oxidoreductase
MHKRKLGRTGPLVSAIGLGCMGMSEFYGPSDPDESLATLHRALDLGITLFDTADVYGYGCNEQLIGPFVEAHRDQILLATKFGIIRTADPSSRNVSGQPEYVKSCCDASLRRLGVDTIDLYYQHRVDPQVPIEDTVGAMSDLVRAGKIRYIGLSEAGPDTLYRAHAVHPVTALQTEYSLWSREPENGILETCRELGIAFVAYSPLGRGFLTGHIRSLNDLSADDFRRTTPRFQADNLQTNLDLVDCVDSLARDKGCTPGQLALAWVLAQGQDIIPIPGTRRRKHLEENAAAAGIGLSQSDLDLLNDIFAPGATSGDRYPAVGMKLVGL